jgi:hypothetical protein
VGWGGGGGWGLGVRGEGTEGVVGAGWRGASAPGAASCRRLEPALPHIQGAPCSPGGPHLAGVPLKVHRAGRALEAVAAPVQLPHLPPGRGGGEDQQRAAGGRGWPRRRRKPARGCRRHEVCTARPQAPPRRGGGARTLTSAVNDATAKKRPPADTDSALRVAVRVKETGRKRRAVSGAGQGAGRSPASKALRLAAACRRRGIGRQLRTPPFPSPASRSLVAERVGLKYCQLPPAREVAHAAKLFA